MTSHEPGSGPPAGSLFAVISGMVQILDRRERRRLYLISSLLVFGGLLEAVGIGIFLPLVAMVSGGPPPSDQGLVAAVYAFLPEAPAAETTLWVAAGLVGLFAVKNAYLTLLVWVEWRFAYSVQVRAQTQVLDAYLSQSYLDYLDSSSSDELRKINAVPSIVKGFSALMGMFAELVLLVLIGALLVAVDPLAVLITGGALGAAGGLFYLLVQRKNVEASEIRLEAKRAMNWALVQSFGAFVEGRILGRERYFVDAFERSARSFERAAVFHELIRGVPYYVMETLFAAGLLLVLVLGHLRGFELSALTPMIAVFLIAAARLAPAVNRLIARVVVIRRCGPALAKVERALKDRRPAVASERLPFERAIDLERVSFAYPGQDRPALEDVSLSIAKGGVVGFVGASGSGKTTLAYVLLGLLSPKSGRVLVDGREASGAFGTWRDRLGFVPQEVFLTESSVEQNVAFGITPDQIDRERVARALRSAELDVLVSGLAQGSATPVGEKGIKLSGGQRQRVGIARALYGDPELIVMDEGTSSLDYENERAIMQTIFSLQGRTVLLIAHQLSTMRRCDRLVFLSNGRIEAEGSFEELLERNAAFRALIQAAEVLPAERVVASDRASRVQRR